MEGKFIAVYRRNRSEAPSSGCSPEEEQMAQFRIHHTRASQIQTVIDHRIHRTGDDPLLLLLL